MAPSEEYLRKVEKYGTEEIRYRQPYYQRNEFDCSHCLSGSGPQQCEKRKGGMKMKYLGTFLEILGAVIIAGALYQLFQTLKK